VSVIAYDDDGDDDDEIRVCVIVRIPSATARTCRPTFVDNSC